MRFGRWAPLFLFLMFAALTANAQVVNALSCSSTDVQNAFNSVVASTTTVNIPAGTCDWTTQVTLTVPSGSTSLSILGAGNLSVLGGGDTTVIVDNYASNNSLLVITTTAAVSYFRIAGVSFEGGTGLVKYNGIVAVGGTSQNFRMDHCHFDSQTYSPGNNSAMIRFTDWVYGVVDHNLFDQNVGSPGVTNGIQVWDDGYGGDSFGDGAWAAPSALGSANFLFIEDNTFNNSFANDCSNGGRFVIRYNTFNSVTAQTHPTGGSGRIRGCRAWEIYNNTFTGSNSSPVFDAYYLSSGTGMFWGNSAPVGYENLISIHSDRVDNSVYAQTATPNGWGYCGTAFNGTGSAWDENTSTTTGYACLDQPGQGKGDLLSGNFPSAVNTTTGTIAWPHEALEPVYEWNDTWNPVPGYTGYVINVYQPTLEVANQDYYTYSSTFNGTSGTGSGLLSARPSTCTPEVAYWATDTQTLYQCATTNTWSVYYQPYTYPHPLDVIPSSNPSIPSRGFLVAGR